MKNLFLESFKRYNKELARLKKDSKLSKIKIKYIEDKRPIEVIKLKKKAAKRNV